MIRIAVIACDHGLGHVRRSTLVADALARAGNHVTLLAPEGSAARVRGSLGTAAPEHVEEFDFATRTTPEALRSGTPAAVRWEERLPDLDGFDRVVCDTLPEIVAVRPDATVIAQFLWHDVLDGFDAAARERAADLARRAQVVLGSAPFAMPAVRALPGFHEVGLLNASGAAASVARGEDLLVSGGTTPAVAELLRAVVAALQERGRGPYAQVRVDRALLPTDPPRWMVQASHTPDLYDRLGAAIVRPGLGVVTELLARSVPMWCVREAGNAELAHNAATLARIGRGYDRGAFDDEEAGVYAVTLVGEVLTAGPRAIAVGEPVALRFDGASAIAERVLEG